MTPYTGLNALERVATAIIRSGSNKLWRVDLVTYREMIEQLDATNRANGRLTVHAESGRPLVCGVPIDVLDEMR